MKKILFTIGCLILLLGVGVGVLYFLPNEMTFKVYNFKGITQTDDAKALEFFQKAGESFPQWQLIAQNNELGRMYEQKQYEELEKKLSEKLTNECATEQEKISEFCENIFYLDGLVQYRLGENLQSKEQKEYFQKAIDSFQKTLAINNENTWAQENIDFILQKSTQQEQQQQGEGEGQQQDGQNGEENEQEGQSQNQEGQGDEQGEGENQQGQEGDEQQGEGENGGEGQTGAEGEDGQEAESRLPQNIQDALERAQEEMEQDQSQEGFNRSQSAAQKNNYKNQDPFEQMIQQFFGGSVGAQMGQKNFTQEIQDPNEKDW